MAHPDKDRDSPRHPCRTTASSHSSGPALARRSTVPSSTLAPAAQSSVWRFRLVVAEAARRRDEDHGGRGDRRDEDGCRGRSRTSCGARAGRDRGRPPRSCRDRGIEPHGVLPPDPDERDLHPARRGDPGGGLVQRPRPMRSSAARSGWRYSSVNASLRARCCGRRAAPRRRRWWRRRPAPRPRRSPRPRARIRRRPSARRGGAAWGSHPHGHRVRRHGRRPDGALGGRHDPIGIRSSSRIGPCSIWSSTIAPKRRLPSAHRPNSDGDERIAEADPVPAPKIQRIGAIDLAREDS